MTTICSRPECQTTAGCICTRVPSTTNEGRRYHGPVPDDVKRYVEDLRARLMTHVVSDVRDLIILQLADDIEDLKTRVRSIEAMVVP